MLDIVLLFKPCHHHFPRTFSLPLLLLLLLLRQCMAAGPAADGTYLDHQIIPCHSASAIMPPPAVAMFPTAMQL